MEKNSDECVSVSPCTWDLVASFDHQTKSSPRGKEQDFGKGKSRRRDAAAAPFICICRGLISPLHPKPCSSPSMCMLDYLLHFNGSSPPSQVQV